jgi:hypothetical protein
MSTAKQRSRLSWLRLSLDGWAVTAAFGLAALVRFGLLKRVPW